ELAVVDDRLAVHEHADDALRLHLPARFAAGHVVHEPLLPEAEPLRVEEHDVGVIAAREEAAKRNAADHGGEERDATDALLERVVLAIEHPRAQEVRRP